MLRPMEAHTAPLPSGTPKEKSDDGRRQRPHLRPVQFVDPVGCLVSSKSKLHPILWNSKGLDARWRQRPMPQVSACKHGGAQVGTDECQAVRYADATSVERFASYMALSAR